MKKRIMGLMAVAALMVVMLAMSVAPAFAVGPSLEQCVKLARLHDDNEHAKLPHFCQA
jgi:hypothetical protein